MKMIEIKQNKINSENVNSVNAREIWKFLEVKTKFADWIQRTIEKFDFAENVDYIKASQKWEASKTGQTQIEYIVTIDMAKELAMVENNPKGKEARKYFINAEKELQNIKQTPPPENNFKLPQNYREALLELVDKVEAIDKLTNEVNHQNQLLMIQQPKVEFANRLEKSIGTLPIRDLAKVYADKNLKIGERKLFDFLRKTEMLALNNKPYQRFVDMGIFAVKEGTFRNPSTGEDSIYLQTRVTAKGQEYIFRKLTMCEAVANHSLFEMGA